MSLRDLAKQVLPEKAATSLRSAREKIKRARVAKLPPLSEAEFREILTSDLGLVAADTVFIHSSIDQLNLGFPFYRILSVIQDVVGPRGTTLFPTYPQESSYEFLTQGKQFDVRKTPSFTGILTEFARRQRNAVRSLHPTKSVCAIGPHARDLTSTHELSPYPYDTCSPYHKIIELGGKIVGIGVSTSNLSFVHCVDDALKDAFPVEPYHSNLFSAPCVNYEGEVELVKTYAHDIRKMRHQIPRFMEKHIRNETGSDLKIRGRKFFRADAAKLFETMLRLAEAGTTIYPRSVYSKKRR